MPGSRLTSYHITFAAPPVISPTDRYAVAWLDLKGITAAVDGIIPMGYTMNPPSIGWATNPEPIAIRQAAVKRASSRARTRAS